MKLDLGATSASLKNVNEIYLASKSPRRLALLQQMGIISKTLMLREDSSRARDVDETPLPSENPYIYVERMAKMKADIGMLRAKQRALPPLPVLGADTIVVFNGTIFGKPADPADAKRMLKLLSGTTHEVLTGVAVNAVGVGVTAGAVSGAGRDGAHSSPPVLPLGDGILIRRRGHWPDDSGYFR